MYGIGQGSSIIYLVPDQVGGGESLSQTLAIGNTTGANDIDLEQLINFLNNTFSLALDANALTANHIVKLQNKSGTLALLSDITGGGESLSQTMAIGNTTGNNILFHSKSGQVRQIGLGSMVEYVTNNDYYLDFVNGNFTKGYLYMDNNSIQVGYNVTGGGSQLHGFAVNGNNTQLLHDGIGFISSFGTTILFGVNVNCEIRIDKSNNHMVMRSLTGEGIKYFQDYSATFVDRSLVDKAFVLNQIGAKIPIIVTAETANSMNSVTRSFLGATGATFVAFSGNGTSNDECSFQFEVPTNYLSGGQIDIYYATTATIDNIGLEFDITIKEPPEDLSVISGSEQ